MSPVWWGNITEICPQWSPRHSPLLFLHVVATEHISDFKFTFIYLINLRISTFDKKNTMRAHSYNGMEVVEGETAGHPHYCHGNHQLLRLVAMAVGPSSHTGVPRHHIQGDRLNHWAVHGLTPPSNCQTYYQTWQQTVAMCDTNGKLMVAPHHPFVSAL